MVHSLLNWLHISAAIAAVGSNITYGIWIARASRDPEMLPFTLRGIKLINDRLANPAYGVLLLTGLLMIFTSELSLTTPWLLSSLVLFAVVALVGMFGYTPMLSRQITILDTKGFLSPHYQDLARHGKILGIILSCLVTAIVFLMVVKPDL